MSSYDENFLQDAGYLRLCALDGDRNAALGDAMGLKAALPLPAGPAITATLPKMGA